MAVVAAVAAVKGRRQTGSHSRQLDCSFGGRYDEPLPLALRSVSAYWSDHVTRFSDDDDDDCVSLPALADDVRQQKSSIIGHYLASLSNAQPGDEP